MATKKKTAEPEVMETPTQETSTEEAELMKVIEELKKEKEKLLEENEKLKNEPEGFMPEDMSGEHDEAYWHERIPYELFYDGEEYSEDVSVKVNGKRYLIKRGEKVMIPRFVAHVLENQAKQRRASADYQRKLQEDFERDRKYLE